jgi:hypothetical protein
MNHKIIETQNYIVDIKDYTWSSNYVLGSDRYISGIYDKITFLDGNISYSENIMGVVKLLNERSQLTVKNVYISPIVQNFNLNGIVYVNSLVDKDLMKTKLYNKIYSWLDERNDFNIEIYKSNIIELIESFNTVSRVDVKIEPENTLRSDGKFNFISGLNPLRFNIDYNLDQDSKNRSVYWRAESSDYGPTNAYKIAKIMQEEVNNFVFNYLSNEQYFYSTSDVNYIWGIKVVNDSKNFNNKINERFFYSKLAKPIYERIKNEISGNFLDNIPYYQTSLFLQDMSNIRKDLLYIIRNNMLDSNGNIAKEYKKIIVSNKELKQLIRGGYSLGNEIVKLKLNFQVIYK